MSSFQATLSSSMENFKWLPKPEKILCIDLILGLKLFSIPLLIGWIIITIGYFFWNSVTLLSGVILGLSLLILKSSYLSFIVKVEFLLKFGWSALNVFAIFWVFLGIRKNKPQYLAITFYIYIFNIIGLIVVGIWEFYSTVIFEWV